MADEASLSPEADVEALVEAVQQRHEGVLSQPAFKRRRLLQGLYSQRQPGAYMLRLKMPGGLLTAEQLDALAEATERFTSTGQAHLTARENIQLHFLPLDVVPEVLRLLDAAGLTTREAGGPTVWNAAACPLAGVCPHETFDVMPFAVAYTRHFLRHPVVQDLPRKFKTSFSGCSTDCGLSAIQDLGFVAIVKGEGNETGFRVTVGGGLSTHPLYGETLYDFVPAADYLRVSEAILRVFNREGVRSLKLRARFKFLVEEIGIDQLRSAVDAELDAMPPMAFEPPPEAPDDRGHGDSLPPDAATADDPAFQRWLKSNVVAQRQPRYGAVYVTVPLGNVNAMQMRALAEATRHFGCGEVRATNRQDFVIPWVRDGNEHDLYVALGEAGLAEPGSGGLFDMAACPGSEACQFGVTNSMGLGRALRDALATRPDLARQAAGLRININGCGYACARHQLGDIGLSGTAVAHDGRLIPAYRISLGGEMPPQGYRLGEQLPVVVPGHGVPRAVIDLLERYVADRLEGESFGDFVQRCWAVEDDMASETYSVEEVETRRKDLYDLLAPSMAPKQYDASEADWDTPSPFKLRIGEGETASAARG